MSITETMTPTQREIVQRHRLFRQSLADKAAALAQLRDQKVAELQVAILQANEAHIEAIEIRPHRTWFEIIDDAAPTPIRIVQRAVCDHYKITIRSMLGAQRTANLIIPRHVAMYLCKELTLKSLPDIGRRFGMRDHTTVLHAVRKVSGWVEKPHLKPDVVADIVMLRAKLERAS